jgi:hypothetical protein
MDLLIIMSVPALSGLVCMVATITGQTLYPRLRPNPVKSRSVVLIFPSRRYY